MIDYIYELLDTFSQSRIDTLFYILFVFILVALFKYFLNYMTKNEENEKKQILKSIESSVEIHEMLFSYQSGESSLKEIRHKLMRLSPNCSPQIISRIRYLVNDYLTELEIEEKLNEIDELADEMFKEQIDLINAGVHDKSSKLVRNNISYWLRETGISVIIKSASMTFITAIFIFLLILIFMKYETNSDTLSRIILIFTLINFVVYLLNYVIFVDLYKLWKAKHKFIDYTLLIVILLVPMVLMQFKISLILHTLLMIIANTLYLVVLRFRFVRKKS